MDQIQLKINDESHPLIRLSEYTDYFGEMQLADSFIFRVIPTTNESNKLEAFTIATYKMGKVVEMKFCHSALTKPWGLKLLFQVPDIKNLREQKPSLSISGKTIPLDVSMAMR